MEATIYKLRIIVTEIEGLQDNEFEGIAYGNENIYALIKGIDFIENYHCAFYRRAEEGKKLIGKKNQKRFNSLKEDTLNDLGSIILLLAP